MTIPKNCPLEAIQVIVHFHTGFGLGIRNRVLEPRDSCVTGNKKVTWFQYSERSYPGKCHSLLEALCCFSATDILFCCPFFKCYPSYFSTIPICEHLLESSLQDDSNELSHYMIWLSLKEIL